MKILSRTSVLLLTHLTPIVSFASVEGTLSSIQHRLMGTILPLAAILGLVFAGFSFVTGNPNARNHLAMAIIGAVVGFAAPSIVSFIQSMVN